MYAFLNAHVVHGLFQPFTVIGDVTNEADAVKIVDATLKHYGKLDILVFA